eukprot:CAMPEP_0194755166 /NCGR_PEP_ID=MMETSP0323_2-20130528/9056_1 /TAXON_ID=2866 ORGANISM="Crypthecodinium cohnii, Strain Seligo" /NCGR_SAMPLE_ID=MMETSP0323_2 /ASSEMBLY_ACC=CAM_ASM_000346 /LENGTH=30 /DNA_ID= /DNA_START= /DNA_END= /DNA_ORIENTATION=
MSYTLQPQRRQEEGLRLLNNQGKPVQQWPE